MSIDSESKLTPASNHEREMLEKVVGMVQRAGRRHRRGSRKAIRKLSPPHVAEAILRQTGHAPKRVVMRFGRAAEKQLRRRQRAVAAERIMEQKLGRK